MPTQLTADESQQLVALFQRATGLVLQLPPIQTGAQWLSEFHAATFRAHEQLVTDSREDANIRRATGNPEARASRPTRPWEV